MPQQYTGTRPQLASPRLVPAGKQWDIELGLEMRGTRDVCAKPSLQHEANGVLTSHAFCVTQWGKSVFLFSLSSWRLFYVKLDYLIG